MHKKRGRERERERERERASSEADLSGRSAPAPAQAEKAAGFEVKRSCQGDLCVRLLKLSAAREAGKF